MDGECSPGDDPQASERPLRRRRTELLKLRHNDGKARGEANGTCANYKNLRLAEMASEPLQLLDRSGKLGERNARRVGHDCVQTIPPLARST